MAGPITPKPAGVAPKVLPEDLQKYTRTPVVTWMRSSPNGPKEAVPGDLAQSRSLWLDGPAGGKAVGVCLDARTLEEAIPLAQQVAHETRHENEWTSQLIPGAAPYTSDVHPQAVLHGEDGHWYAAPLDLAPAWAPDAKRGPLDVTTDRQWEGGAPQADRELYSFLGPAAPLAAVVDDKRVWSLVQGDAIFPVASDPEKK